MREHRDSPASPETGTDVPEKPNLSDQEARRPALGRLPTLLGLLLSMAGVAVSVWFGVTRVQHKRLESVAISHISLVDVKEELRGKLTVLYSGHEVPNISKYSFVVRNAGNEPMRPEDFVEMPRFEFPHDMGVMDCRIVDRIPSDLACDLVFDTLAGKCTISFDLLNPDDQVTVDVLYTGQTLQTPRLMGRIAGVRRISNLSRIQGEAKTNSNRILFLKVLASLFTFVVLLIGIALIAVNYEEWKETRKRLAGSGSFLARLANTRSVQDFVKVLGERDARDSVGHKALEVLIGKPTPQARSDLHLSQYPAVSLSSDMPDRGRFHVAPAAYREWYSSPFKPDLTQADMVRAIELIRQHAETQKVAMRKSIVGAAAWVFVGLGTIAGSAAIIYFVWF